MVLPKKVVNGGIFLWMHEEAVTQDMRDCICNNNLSHQRILILITPCLGRGLVTMTRQAVVSKRQSWQ